VSRSLAVKILGPDIKSSPARLDVRVGLNIVRVAPFLLLLAGIIVSGQVLIAAIIGGAVIGVFALAYWVVRLTADDHGVRVLNWWNWKTFAWSDITDVTIRQQRGRSPVVLFSLKDGRQKRALATLGGWNGVYSDEELTRVVHDVLRMRQRHLPQHPPN
jgi:hypothetical protein